MMKNQRLKRLFSLLLALLLFLCVFGGCQKKEPDAGGVLVDKELQQPSPVITFGSYEIPFDYYRYIYLTQKDELTNGDKEFFKTYPHAEAHLKDSVYRYFRYLAGFYSLLDQYKVTLTAEERAAILERVAAVREQTSSDFAELLNQVYLNESLYQELVMEEELETKLHNVLFLNAGAPFSLSADEVVARYQKEFFRGIHIRCTGKKQAEQAWEELQKGVPFEQVLSKYNQDPAMDDQDEGRYFVRGDNEKAYDEAAFALKESAYSPVISCSDGYYILYRMPMNEDLIRADMETFRNRAYSAAYNRLLADAVKDIQPEFCSIYDQIKPDTVQ